MSKQSADGDVVQIAWIELNTKTGETTLRASTGIQDPLAFAQTLADLAVQYAVERALDAARIEHATLATLPPPSVISAPAGRRKRGRA